MEKFGFGLQILLRQALLLQDVVDLREREAVGLAEIANPSADFPNCGDRFHRLLERIFLFTTGRQVAQPQRTAFFFGERALVMIGWCGGTAAVLG